MTPLRNSSSAVPLDVESSTMTVRPQQRGRSALKRQTREYSRVPECLAVLAVLVTLTCIFYYEVVFLGRTFLPLESAGVMGLSGPYGDKATFVKDQYLVDPGASTWQTEPWTKKVSADYGSRQIPLWNEDQGFGTPLLANGQSGALDILRLPMWLSAKSIVWDSYYLLRFVFGGLATYAFARRVRLGTYSSVFMAIAYVFSGHFIFFVSNTWIEAYYLLPALLLANEVILTDSVRVGFCLNAIVIALTVFVGMPEVTLLVLLEGAGFAAFSWIWITLESASSKRRQLTCAIQLISSWIVGLLISAPLLLPLMEFVTNSSQVADRRNVYGLAFAPLRAFVFWLFPYLLGKPLDPTAANAINHFVGVTVFIFAIYGAFPYRSRPYARVGTFALFASTILLAKVFGFPIINDLGAIPLLNRIQIEKWVSPVAGFSIVVLSAVGVERLQLEKLRVGRMAFAALSCILLLGAGMWANRDTLVHVSPDEIRGAVAIACGCSLLSLSIMAVKKHFPPKAVGICCCGLVAAELLAYTPRGVYQQRYDRLVEPPFVGYLQDQRSVRGPLRVFGIDSMLFPNFPSAYGLADIRSVDALYLDRYLKYVQEFLSPHATDRFVGGSYASSERSPGIHNNPWFDLTGVRYVITDKHQSEPDFTEGDIIGDVMARSTHAPTVAMSATVFRVDGVDEPVLFEHPPAEIKYPLTVTPDRDILRFAPLLNPAVWDPSKGDGVVFEVDVDDVATHYVVYRRAIDPKNDPLQRHLVEDRVDLSSFDGQHVVIVFKTNPLKSPDFDWAGWGALRLGSRDERNLTQYKRVYDGEAQVYENRRAFPRAFLVSSVRRVSGPNGAIRAMKGNGFNPAKIAVVEGLARDVGLELGNGTGSVRMARYSSQFVAVQVVAKRPSLLVLTDAYYPGWIAKVDGTEERVYPTDLAFRGVAVPAGSHTVTFEYRPRAFYAGLALAGVGFTLLICVGSGCMRRVAGFRRRHTEAL